MLIKNLLNIYFLYGYKDIMEVFLMDILLIRHGEAEEQNIENSQLDRNRILTDKGKREIKKLSKQLLKVLNLKVYSEIRIVTSPAIRALQSGEIIQSRFKLKNIYVNENLYLQNYFEILSGLIQDLSSNSLLIICGHNPNISILLEGMTKINLDFPKAGAALIKYEEGNIGNLKLFINPCHFTNNIAKEPKQKKKKLNKKVKSKFENFTNINLSPAELFTDEKEKHKTFLNLRLTDVEHAINNQLNIYSEHKNLLENQLYNPEYIHEMRLSLRKILTLLDFAKLDLNLDTYEKFVELLKHTNLKLAKLRDLDIFIYNIRNFEIENNLFLEIAMNKQSEYLKELLAYFLSNEFIPIETYFKDLEFTSDSNKFKYIDGYVRDNLSLLISESKLFNKKSRDIETKDLHNLRITGKKIKNSMELFPDQIHNKILHYKNNNKDFVKHLGEYNDAEIGLKILEELTLDLNSTSKEAQIEESAYKLIFSKFMDLKQQSYEKAKYFQPPWS